MNLECDTHDSVNPTFIWKKGEKIIARVTLYADGLLELSCYQDRSKLEIEDIGNEDGITTHINNWYNNCISVSVNSEENGTPELTIKTR